jgi:hypothetical protein
LCQEGETGENVKELIDILRKRNNGELKMSDAKLLENFFKKVK